MRKAIENLVNVAIIVCVYFGAGIIIELIDDPSLATNQQLYFYMREVVKMVSFIVASSLIVMGIDLIEWIKSKRK